VGGDVSESCRAAVSAGARDFNGGLFPFFGSRCEERRRVGGPRRLPERAGGLARAAGGRSSAAPNMPLTVPFYSVVDVGCPGPDSRRRRPTCDQPILERPPTRPVRKTPRSLPPDARRRLPTPYLAPLTSSMASEVHRMRSRHSVTSRTGTDDANRYIDLGFLLVLLACRPRISHRYRDIAVPRWTGSGFGHTVTSQTVNDDAIRQICLGFL
jgi:hypothetical protein